MIAVNEILDCFNNNAVTPGDTVTVYRIDHQEEYYVSRQEYLTDVIFGSKRFRVARGVVVEILNHGRVAVRVEKPLANF